MVQLPIAVTTIILVAPLGIAAVAWVRVAAVTSQVTLLLILVSRELRTSVRAFLAALMPAAVTAGGVAVGAGAVRLAWPDLSLGPLALGTVSGAGTGLLALRLFAGGTLRDLKEIMGARTRPREAT
jgi:hypothetical protein